MFTQSNSRKKSPASIPQLVNALLALCLIQFSASSFGEGAKPPQVGDQAPDFTLRTPDGKDVMLSKLAEQGSVVVVMLRGWPGYQCPLCTRQVGDFIGKADAFEAAKAQVLLIYPGPAENLQKYAEEFITAKKNGWPGNFHYVTDPDYVMTNLYHLRWDAPNETAYPATFVVDQGLMIRFANVSDSHGGRVKAEQALEVLKIGSGV